MGSSDAQKDEAEEKEVEKEKQKWTEIVETLDGLEEEPELVLEPPGEDPDASLILSFVLCSGRLESGE